MDMITDTTKKTIIIIIFNELSRKNLLKKYANWLFNLSTGGYIFSIGK